MDSSMQKEIDIVEMMPNSKIMIEIKYRENPKIKETEAIGSTNSCFTAHY